MFFMPMPSEVLDDLGDKVVHGLSRAVALGRTDLATYRETFPGWVANHTERGLANWIHDRVWSHLLPDIEEIDEVSVVDREPTRELYVGVTYRIRVKRHHLDGAVNTYPTPTALKFLGQDGTIPIPGLEEINLIAGYEWDRETRTMGAPLLSLREGRSNVLWSVELPEISDQNAENIVRPVRPGPSGPSIGLPDVGFRRDGSIGTENE